jgi:two-component system cell cycle sensor histidine kinase/response regulator CckA
MMPVMGGAATISALMQLDPRVRVIATSGLNFNVAELKAAQSGVKLFLRKPFTNAMLLNALSEVLHSAI